MHTPLKPHFFIVKLGCTGVYNFSLFLIQNIACGYKISKSLVCFCTVSLPEAVSAWPGDAPDAVGSWPLPSPGVVSRPLPLFFSHLHSSAAAQSLSSCPLPTNTKQKLFFLFHSVLSLLRIFELILDRTISSVVKTNEPSKNHLLPHPAETGLPHMCPMQGSSPQQTQK